MRKKFALIFSKTYAWGSEAKVLKKESRQLSKKFLQKLKTTKCRYHPGQCQSVLPTVVALTTKCNSKFLFGSLPIL